MEDAKKPWAGRFEKPTEPSVEDFTESISFDKQLYKYDIQGSIAHATMLAACGLLTEEEKEAIILGLKEIEKEIDQGNFSFKKGLEDIHMNIEVALIRKAGEAGRKLHTARSRNDQVALDLRLWTRETITQVSMLLEGVQLELVQKARAHLDLIFPGFTHLQHAQPVLLAHHLLAYVEMLERDKERLVDSMTRVNRSPLGACALAGTTLPIDPEMTARLLGFSQVCANSIDAVSDRDFCLEFASNMAILSMHLSRLAEEWILWISPEFDFIELDESLCTGSSIMPQKRNPDVLELLRAKCARVYGNLFFLFSLMKALPLSYNRDMQEDKVAVFDIASTVKASLSLLKKVVNGTTFKPENIALACTKGYLDATALAEYLVTKGLPFRQAHEVVGKLVRRAVQEGKTLKEFSLDELRQSSPLIDKEVYDFLGVENCIRRYKGTSSTSPSAVRERVGWWWDRLWESKKA
ncbi:MAG: argininosuccinate lyase [Planctomycetota bacterium]